MWKVTDESSGKESNEALVNIRVGDVSNEKKIVPRNSGLQDRISIKPGTGGAVIILRPYENGNGIIELINVSGAVVLSEVVEGSIHTLSPGSAAGGVYILRYKDEARRAFRKVCLFSE